jgi:hypothetical protein
MAQHPTSPEPDPQPVSNKEDAMRTAATQMRPNLGRPRPDQAEARLAKLETTVRLLSETVSRLAATLGRVADQRPDPAAPALTSGPASHDELVRWVHWLVDNYELGYSIPSCWAQHPGLVRELEALRLGWLGTIAHNAPSLAAIQWHEYLARSMERAGKYREACQKLSRGGHKSLGVAWSDRHEPTGPPIDLTATSYRAEDSQPPTAPPAS